MKRWTVLLLALVLTGCTTVAGASGGTMQSTVPEKVTVQVYVDNQPQAQLEVYEKDGRIYAPLDALGRAVDRRIEAGEGRINIYHFPDSQKVPGVDRLNAAYDEKIKAAVDLLAYKAPSHYRKLASYAVFILPGFQNATAPEANTITVSQTDLDKGTVTWIAGTLAHEAEHLRIYHTDRTLYGNAKENERLAYEANLDALKLVGADQREIDWTLKALQEPPTWEDISGKK